MQNQLCLFLSSIGQASLVHNDLCVIHNEKEITYQSVSIQGCKIRIEIQIPVTYQTHLVQIVKNIDARTRINLDDITVDGTSLPSWFFHEHGVFSFANQNHAGSREWHPSGTWHITLQSPLVTWILDQKILHESRYNQDYLFPWSYKLGPDSVSDLGQKIDDTIKKAREILC